MQRKLCMGEEWVGGKAGRWGGQENKGEKAQYTGGAF